VDMIRYCEIDLVCNNCGVTNAELLR
jgi:hypothetical protein